jgi:uncharacterized DUF497 family protein
VVAGRIEMCGHDAHIMLSLGMTIEWNEEKNFWLKQERGLSFEEIEARIYEGAYVEIREHYNQTKHPGQSMVIFWKNNLIHCAPFVYTETGIFLKTIFPSRKLTVYYRRKP